MNKKMIFVTVLLTTLLWNANSVLSEGDHDDEETGMHEVTDQCTTPTAELFIKADNAKLAYTATEYHVEKNTCYELTFENLSGIEHDVSIEEVHGDAGIEEVHIHIASPTDGDAGVKTLHILTPDADVDFKIQCTVLGHDEMQATLIVGEGSPDDDEGFLPINMLSAVFGFALITLIVKFKRN